MRVTIRCFIVVCLFLRHFVDDVVADYGCFLFSLLSAASRWKLREGGARRARGAGGRSEGQAQEGGGEAPVSQGGEERQGARRVDGMFFTSVVMAARVVVVIDVDVDVVVDDTGVVFGCL